MSFEVIPAIDLRGGRVVRLRQGDYAQETCYATEAQGLTARYAQAGTRWLHVVDLDGARDGSLHNLCTIESIARTPLQVQAGGGVREEGDLRRLFDAGVARVVIGSVAVAQPELASQWIERFGAERVVIALDTLREDGRWILRTSGWSETGERTLDELAPWYAARGARHLLCTDIARDGMLAGGNIELYGHLAQIAPSLAVQASGGVCSLQDVRDARAAGASAVILGRALLENMFTLEEALAC